MRNNVKRVSWTQKYVFKLCIKCEHGMYRMYLKCLESMVLIKSGNMKHHNETKQPVLLFLSIMVVAKQVLDKELFPTYKLLYWICQMELI